MKRILIFLILLLLQISVQAQQLDQIGKKNPIKINGGISLNQVYRSNASQAMNPYSMVASGNISTSIYGLAVPLSFTWSNNQWSYTQPFNQFSLSPTYKWATLHMGWSSMSFSPYSLSGHSFAGVGVDLKPSNKLSISAMYGRLKKELVGDTILGYDPQYRRMGTGIKGEVKIKNGQIGMHIFYASDDTHKPSPIIDSLGISPMENIVLGTSFSIRPVNQISVKGELNVSALSADRRISKANDLKGAASSNKLAAKTDISFNSKLGSIGVGIEYVEPGYQTLGSYYTVNDFLNYTVNVASAILQGKVSFAGSLGVRQTNLDNQSDTDQKDLVKNINIGFTPNDKLNFSLSYSNLYNYSFVRTSFEEANIHTQYEMQDTLKFTQINENVNISAAWKIKETKEVKHSINANLGLQQSSQEQSDTPDKANTIFINASGGYRWALPKQAFSLGINANYNRNKTDASTNESYGPVLSIRKKMFDKKLRNSFTLTWNKTLLDTKATGNVFNFRLGSNYALKKKHILNLNLAYTQNKRAENTKSYYTATLGYSFNFGWPKGKG